MHCFLSTHRIRRAPNVLRREHTVRPESVQSQASIAGDVDAYITGMTSHQIQLHRMLFSVENQQSRAVVFCGCDMHWTFPQRKEIRQGRFRIAVVKVHAIMAVPEH